MDKISTQKMAMTDSFRVFGGIFSAHTSPKLPTKHKSKETSSRGNIWGPCYIPKGEGLGGV